jgi:rhamnogalacturonan acetylesterase
VLTNLKMNPISKRDTLNKRTNKHVGLLTYINNYTTLPITNLARNGRSARSLINEGLWSALLCATKAGDYVLVEMGQSIPPPM